MKKKWVLVTLKVLVSATLIWFLVAGIDLGAARARITQISPVMLAAAIAAMLVQMAIGGMRWKVILDAIGDSQPLTRLIRFFYIGSFFNQTLPSSVGGDAVRMFIAHRSGVSMSGSINGVILERGMTVIALVVLASVFLPFFLPGINPELARWGYPAIALLVVGTLFGVWLLVNLDRLPEEFRRWRIFRGMAKLGGDAREVFLHPGPLARALFWGLMGQVNVIVMVFFLARGLGLGVSFLDCLILVPPALLATVLPISIAGWGVREGVMVAGFGLIGVPAEGALVLSVLFGLTSAAVSLPGGLVWLLGGGAGAKIPETIEDMEKADIEAAKTP